jgi:S-adenosyl-L-methionine hydrolase (adenosine-forming)
MKGVLLGIAPDLTIVDLTHEIPAQDVAGGARALADAVAFFPPGTVHVAVVDPGVGTARRALAIETGRGWLVGPDNGVLSLAAPPGDVVRVLDVSRAPVIRTPTSRTFHGRDVFAPVAAHLVAGVDPEALGRPAGRIVRLREPAPRRGRGTVVGRVVWVDRFGNLITNVTRDDLATVARPVIEIGGRRVRLRAAYGEAAAGDVLALVNSADRLEIAVCGGSAAEELSLKPGATVSVRSGRGRA